MAILNLNDPQQQQPVDHKFRTQQELKTSTVFDKELPSNLIKYQVDGMRWSIDYFNQIVNINTQPMAPDVNIPNTTLKYNRIDKLDIYVDTGLPDGTVTDIAGSGIINAGFIPYIGDAFIATLAGGRIGIFVLTNVNKEYYNGHDIYAIDYKLTYFLDTDPTIHNDLVYKTIRTYTYDKSAIGTNTPPIILSKDYATRLNLSNEINKLISHYFKLFYDKDTKLFRLPTSASIYTDELVADSMFKLLSVNDVPDLANMVRPTKHITSTTLWDAIFNRDVTLFSTANMDIKYTPVGARTSVSLKLSSYLGMEYCTTDRPTASTVIPPIINNPIYNRVVTESPVTNRDTSYLFSTDFYKQTVGISYSKLEVALIMYIQGKPPIRSEVEALLTEYVYWNYQDQYNLIPILLILAKSLVNSSYSAI